jgi:hypothetical protein
VDPGAGAAGTAGAGGAAAGAGGAGAVPLPPISEDSEFVRASDRPVAAPSVAPAGGTVAWAAGGVAFDEEDADEVPLALLPTHVEPPPPPEGSAGAGAVVREARAFPDRPDLSVLPAVPGLPEVLELPAVPVPPEVPEPPEVAEPPEVPPEPVCDVGGGEFVAEPVGVGEAVGDVVGCVVRPVDAGRCRACPEASLAAAGCRSKPAPRAEVSTTPTASEPSE